MGKKVKTMEDVEKSMKEMNEKLINKGATSTNIEELNLNNVKKAIDSVDTDKIIERVIGGQEETETSEVLSKDLKECIEEVSNLQEKQNKIIESIKNKNKEEAIKEIQKEISNAEKIKEKIEKVANKEKISNGQISYIWNGMSYTF